MKMKFLFLTVLFSLTSLSQVSTQKVENKELVPANLLFKESQNYLFRISPDGKFFAEIVNINGKIDLVIIDIDNYKLFKRIPLFQNNIDNLIWFDSDQLLFESYGKIFIIGKDGSNQKTLIHSRYFDKNVNYHRLDKLLRYNHIESTLPDDKDHILVETTNSDGYSDLIKVNVYTGEEMIVNLGEKHQINKWITDANGKPALVLKIKNDIFNYYQWNENSNNYEPLMFTHDNKQYGFHFTAKTLLKKKSNLLGIGYDSDVVYILSSIDTDRRKLLSINRKKHKIIDTLVSDQTFDIGTYDGEDVGLLFDHKSKSLAGVTYEGVGRVYKWMSKDFASAYSILKGLYPNFNNDILDVDENNQRFLVKQWSNQKAGNIGVFNNVDNTYSVLLSLNEELDKYDLAFTKPIITETEDNNKLLSYLTVPNTIKDSLNPLVVIPHGGPWARDYDDLDGFSQYFATRGYFVLRVNYRGSTGFGKEHLLGGVNGLHSIMIDDIAVSTRNVLSEYAIDKTKVYIFGHSYGGYATYLSLIKKPELFSAGVALSAPSDFRSLMRWMKKEDKDFAYDFWEEALGGSDKEHLNNISPISSVSLINDPLLVFHGKFDQVIPVEQAEMMVKELKMNNKNVNLEILQSEGHSLRNSFSIDYILRTANEFFANTNN